MSEERPSTPEEQISKLKKQQAPAEREDVGDIFSSVEKPAEEQPKTQKKRKWKLIVVITILVLITVGVTALFTFEKIRNTVIEPEVQEEIIREMPEPVEVEKGENPFAAMLEGENKEYSGSGNTSIEKDTENETFVFDTSGITLAPVSVEKFEPSVDMDCTLSYSTDICFIGTVSFKSDSLKPVDVFAVSNMLENRLFEELDDYKAFNIDGAEAGLYGVLHGIDVSTPTAGIVVEDGSGFIITPHGGNAEDYDFSVYQESFNIK